MKFEVGEIEPVSLIVTALASRATAALKDTANQALKDAYGRLKHFLRRKLEGNKEAEVALERYETNPEVWELPLQDELARTGAGQDEQLIQAAETLMALVDPHGSQVGKYNVQITGPAQGTIIGDHASLHRDSWDAGGKEVEEVDDVDLFWASSYELGL